MYVQTFYVCARNIKEPVAVDAFFAAGGEQARAVDLTLGPHSRKAGRNPALPYCSDSLRTVRLWHPWIFQTRRP
jgi:hypothetical protein